MKKRNEKFFEGKTWNVVFEQLKFSKHYEKLCKKLKEKKIVFYGAGLMFDYFAQNYDLSKLNIAGIADKKIETKNIETYQGIKTLSFEELKNCDFDCILITTQYPVVIRNFLKFELFGLNKKCPPIYFLLNKPFMLYLEEIWE
ncbi:hypothetical protein IJ843_02850 [bacterium]|nr:hypothetical protein [bacterium]